MHSFESVHLSVCVYWAGAQILYMGLLRGLGVDGKLSILVFKDFGVGAKFGQKMKSVCWVKVVENGAKILGGIQKYILVVIFIIITNLCT